MQNDGHPYILILDYRDASLIKLYFIAYIQGNICHIKIIVIKWLKHHHVKSEYTDTYR